MAGADSFLEFLGGTSLAAAGATLTVTIQPREFLQIEISATPASTTGLLALRFNADSGSNYQSRIYSYAAATATPTENQTSTTTMGRLEIASTAAASRSFLVIVANNLAFSKIAAITGFSLSGTAAVGPLIFGGCEWVNTTAQITQIDLIDAGAGNLNVGSTMAVYGGDFL